MVAVMEVVLAAVAVVLALALALALALRWRGKFARMLGSDLVRLWALEMLRGALGSRG